MFGSCLCLCNPESQGTGIGKSNSCYFYSPFANMEAQAMRVIVQVPRAVLEGIVQNEP